MELGRSEVKSLPPDLEVPILSVFYSFHCQIYKEQCSKCGRAIGSGKNLTSDVRGCRFDPRLLNVVALTIWDSWKAVKTHGGIYLGSPPVKSSDYGEKLLEKVGTYT